MVARVAFKVLPKFAQYFIVLLLIFRLLQILIREVSYTVCSFRSRPQSALADVGIAP